jgi:hypothetical protein
MSEQIALIAEERGSQAVLGSSRAAIAEPPRSALPAFTEEPTRTLSGPCDMALARKVLERIQPIRGLL